MGPDVELRFTRNKDEIMGVLKTPGIWENITGDNYIDPDEFNLKLDLKTVFVLGVVDEQVIGCGIAHKEEEWKVHLNVIPEYRKQYSEQFAKKCIQWVWENIKPKKIIADIHPKYSNVVAFAERMKFKQIENDNEKYSFELVRPT